MRYSTLPKLDMSLRNDHLSNTTLQILSHGTATVFPAQTQNFPAFIFRTLA